MKRTHKIVAAAIATLSLAAVTAVFASSSMGMGPMGGMHGGFGPGGHPAAQVDTHLGQLKGDLGITATQEPGWQAFAGKAKQQAQSMQATRAKMHESAGSTPDPMAQRTEIMKQRMGNMDAMNAAKKDLDAVLTPEQKTTADKRFGQMGQMGQMGVHLPCGIN